MHNFLRWTSAAALFAALFAAAPAEATTLREMTFDERVSASELIVRGTVQETWTEHMPDGQVWTRAQVAVEAVFKGDSSLEMVIVDQIGGAYGSTFQVVPGSARFSAGEEVVLMLDERPSGRLLPLGMSTGKWTVRLDPYSHQPIVQRFDPGHGEEYDHRFIPLPQAAELQQLSDLEGRIIDSVRRTAGVKEVRR